MSRPGLPIFSMRQGEPRGLSPEFPSAQDSHLACRRGGRARGSSVEIRRWPLGHDSAVRNASAEVAASMLERISDTNDTR